MSIENSANIIIVAKLEISSITANNFTNITNLLLLYLIVKRIMDATRFFLISVLYFHVRVRTNARHFV